MGSKQSNFYNKGVKHKWAEYKISVHHVLWPIPANAINTNIKGIINQNIGYPGAENNVEPLIVPKRYRTRSGRKLKNIL